MDSSALYIKGFLRPLVAKRVKEQLLDKFGTVKKWWMDAIKTHCYVVVSYQRNVFNIYVSQCLENSSMSPTKKHKRHLPALMVSSSQRDTETSCMWKVSHPNRPTLLLNKNKLQPKSGSLLIAKLHLL